MQEPTLREFVRNLLSLPGNLSDGMIDKITTGENMKHIEIAFTDETFDPNKNNEYFEYIGDKVVNPFVGLYLIFRFSNITNEGVMSKIYQNLQDKKMLGRLALKYGFDKYIRSRQTFPIGDKSMNKDYLSLLENTFEAFWGCIFKIIIKIYKNEGEDLIGAALQSLFNILRFLYDAEKIPTGYDEINDPVSRLKVIYDRFGWGMGKGAQNLVYEKEYTNVEVKMENGEIKQGQEHKVTVYFWYNKYESGILDKFTKVDYAVDKLKYRTKLAEGYGSTDTIAKNNAALDAIRKLQDMGIIENINPEKTGVSRNPGNRGITIRDNKIYIDIPDKKKLR